MRVLTLSAFLLAQLFIAGLYAPPAAAQSKKELAAQNAALAQRLTRLEQRMLTGDPAAERLMQRIDALETSQRALRGEVERLTYERDTLTNEVKALSSDIREMQALSSRIQIHLDAVDLVAKEQARRPVISSGPTSPISSVPSAPVFKEQTMTIPSSPTTQTPTTETLGGQAAITQSAPSNDVTQLGQLGKTKLAEGDYAGAQIALKQYIEFNSGASDIGEMQYWLGESYFVRGGFADAAAAFIASMRQDANGPKGPEAMVRLAASLRELGQTAEACQTLASFPAQYPNASASVKAKASTVAARTGC
jgi:tol-pal system protein YbgF